MKKGKNHRPSTSKSASFSFLRLALFPQHKRRNFRSGWGPMQNNCWNLHSLALFHRSRSCYFAMRGVGWNRVSSSSLERKVGTRMDVTFRNKITHIHLEIPRKRTMHLVDKKRIAGEQIWFALTQRYSRDFSRFFHRNRGTIACVGYREVNRHCEGLPFRGRLLGKYQATLTRK